MPVLVKRRRDMGFPLADVRDRIAALRRLETALGALVSECRKGRTSCLALQELFAG